MPVEPSTQGNPSDKRATLGFHELRRRAYRSKIVAVEDTYLTNVRIGWTRPPKGDDWEAVVFTRHKNGLRGVITLRGRTRRDLRAKVADLAKGVTILD